MRRLKLDGVTYNVVKTNTVPGFPDRRGLILKRPRGRKCYYVTEWPKPPGVFSSVAGPAGCPKK